MPYKDHEICLRKAAEYRAKNRDAIRARRAGQSDKIRAQARARYAADPQRWRDEFLQRRYGITQADYDSMLAAQGGVCAICKRADWCGPGKRPHIDHNHTTKKVRGLLCLKCNVLIGMAQEKPEVFRAAGDYLVKHEI